MSEDQSPQDITHRDLYVKIGEVGVKIDNLEKKVDHNAEHIDQLKEKQDERTGVEKVAKWLIGIGAGFVTGLITVLYKWWLDGGSN